jgi:hypothetical protein
MTVMTISHKLKRKEKTLTQNGDIDAMRARTQDLCVGSTRLTNSARQFLACSTSRFLLFILTIIPFTIYFFMVPRLPPRRPPRRPPRHPPRRPPRRPPRHPPRHPPRRPPRHPPRRPPRHPPRRPPRHPPRHLGCVCVIFSKSLEIGLGLDFGLHGLFGSLFLQK